jgi:AcrR family transcriptional regulator
LAAERSFMPPLERYFKLPKEKQDRLVSAARAEFVSCGFSRASFNRIIETAGISKGSAYYYFADKADLFGEVIERLLAELIAKVGPLREARDADDFWASLWEWVRSTVAEVAAEPDLGALGRCLYQETEAQRTVARLRDQVHSVVQSTLVRGQALGAVRSDVPTDMLAVGLTHLLLGLDRWFAERFEQLKPGEIEPLSAKMLELCRDLAEPKPQARRPA